MHRLVDCIAGKLLHDLYVFFKYNELFYRLLIGDCNISSFQEAHWNSPSFNSEGKIYVFQLDFLSSAACGSISHNDTIHRVCRVRPSIRQSFHASFVCL